MGQGILHVRSLDMCWHSSSAGHPALDFTHGTLFLILDVEVVEEGFEVVLGGKAGVKQEALDAGPFSEASIVKHLQVVGDDEGDDSCR